jgi:hypothetical protein
MKSEQGLAKSSSLRSMVSNFLDLLVAKMHQCSHNQSSIAVACVELWQLYAGRGPLSTLWLVPPYKNDDKINLHIQDGTVSHSHMEAVGSSGMCYRSSRLHGVSSENTLTVTVTAIRTWSLITLHLLNEALFYRVLSQDCQTQTFYFARGNSYGIVDWII